MNRRANRRDQEEEPEDIGDEPWRDQKGTGDEHSGTIGELTAGDLTLIQLPPNPVEDRKPGATDKERTEQRRGNGDPERPSQPDLRANPKEGRNFGEGHQSKEGQESHEATLQAMRSRTVSHILLPPRPRRTERRVTDERPIPKTMKAVRLHPPGGLDNLVHEEVETPTPVDGEALIKVHAAAITRDELNWPVDRLPAIPSYEMSGTVMAVGEGVAQIEIGQAVYALTDFDRNGVAAEYAVVQAERLASKPQTLSHIESAAIPLSALSAMQGLFDFGQLERDQRVVIHGGGGGVGAYAVQLARRHGAYVIATTSQERAQTAQLLGANEVIDHETADFSTIEPVSLVFDTGGGERLIRSVSIVEPGGRLVSVAERPPHDLSAEQGVEAIFFIVEPNPGQLNELALLADQGHLQVLVDKTYHLVDAREAFGRSLTRSGRGKVVLSIVDDD